METVRLYFVVLAVCSSYGAKDVDLKNELSKALHHALSFISIISGNGLTEEDIEQFDFGTKLEDVSLRIENLITKNGYVVEKYKVTTEDGYILTLFRIPSSGRPILLIHGILLSSDDWVTPGPKSGIAYMLAAEGFDVWLGNVRGNKYSRRHVSLSPDSAEFWDFSWDEMGRYDLPAIIDFILNATRHSKLIYVGHSQGCASFFVLGSDRPEYTQKISLMIALAPAGRVTNFKSPFLLLWKLLTPLPPGTAIELIRKAGFNDLLPISRLTTFILMALCKNLGIVTKHICSNLVFLIAGFSYSNMNLTTLPVVLSHIKPGGSTKQLEHYAQTVTSGKFTKFDYGKEKNTLLYGVETPPEYDIGSIITPLAIFYSDHDWLAAEPDIYYLRSKLNSVVDFYKVPVKNFSHLDFVFGKDVGTVIISRMLKLIQIFKT